MYTFIRHMGRNRQEIINHENKKCRTTGAVLNYAGDAGDLVIETWRS